MFGFGKNSHKNEKYCNRNYYNNRIDWGSTIGMYLLNCLGIVAVVFFGWVIYEVTAPSEPTNLTSTLRGQVYKRYDDEDKQGRTVYCLHLGGMKKKSHTNVAVTPVFNGKSVSTAVVPYSYETNVPNDEEIWTDDPKMKAFLDKAMQEDDRITILCRRWNHRGGKEAFKISE
jgi:hypothetical protein